MFDGAIATIGKAGRAFVRASVVTAALVGLAPAGFAQPDTTSKPPEHGWQSVSTFESTAGWRLSPSDGVQASASAEVDEDGQAALRIEVNFVAGSGFLVLAHDLPFELADNYRFEMQIKGSLPDNNLEFKLVDRPMDPTGGMDAPAPSGESVWWVNKRGFSFPKDWTTLVYRPRAVEFAWGPAGGGPPKNIKRLELAIASAQGGSGVVWIRGLRYRALPPVSSEPLVPAVAASSVLDDRHGAAAVLTPDAAGWQSRLDATEATFTLSYPAARELGGLTLRWAPGQQPLSYDVQTSEDGQAFATLRTIDDSNGGLDAIPLRDVEARAVRLVMRRPAVNQGFGLLEFNVEPPEFGESGNALFASVARRVPRGQLPRYTLGEQAYWTVAGVSGDTREALMDEDGMVEVDKQGFSLEPFIFESGALRTWADTSQALHRLYDTCLPMPIAIRDYDGLQLGVTAWCDGEPGKSVLYIRYRLGNRRKEPVSGSLLIAARPFQVLPPWQRLNFDGGFTPIRTIEAGAGELRVNGQKTVICLTPPLKPEHLGVTAWSQGDVVDFFRRGDVPPATSAADPDGLGSGGIQWPFALQPGADGVFFLAVPMHESGRGTFPAAETLRGRAGSQIAMEAFERTRARWIEAMKAITIDLPEEDSGRDLVQTLAANLGYILVNRDGPGIQPGSRTYERSWIRDGSMTSSALLQLGHAEEARQFVEWYAAHQYDTGKVPCVVDTRGPDPVVENDSHGQLIWAIANYARFTGDTAFLRAQFPRIQKAVEWIEQERGTRMTERYSTLLGSIRSGASFPTERMMSTPEPGKPAVPLAAFYGLMPESISHEGYSAKPMHSYWDDLFTLRGLRDAAWAAEQVGETERAAKWKRLEEAFRSDLIASYQLTMKTHGIDYLPGCVELGDFDATSTSVMLYPLGEVWDGFEPALRRTFMKYVEHVRERRTQPSDYTPYEWRNVGALVRLGMKGEAWEVAKDLLKDRRPLGWKHWGEVVRKGYRDPAFIGDMPHTWCGSDFMNAVLAMLIFERGDGTLVLFAGVPESWSRTKNGASFTDLHTSHGTVTASALSTNGGFRVKVDAKWNAGAAARLEVCSPGDTPPKSATLDGQAVDLHGGRVIVETLPAEVVFSH